MIIMMIMIIKTIVMTITAVIILKSIIKPVLKIAALPIRLGQLIHSARCMKKMSAGRLVIPTTTDCL